MDALAEHEKDPYPGFQVEEDLRVEQTSWVLETVQFVLLAVLIAASLLGLTGSGPLAQAEQQSGEMRAGYQRMQRYLTPTRLVVDVARAEDRFRLSVDRVMVDSYVVRDISPQPESVSSESGGISYEFALAPGTRSGRVVFDLEPRRLGMLAYTLQGTPGGRMTIRQFVFP